MIAFVGFMFLAIFLPYLILIRSDFLDLLREMRGLGKEMEHEKTSKIIIAVLVSLMAIYDFLVCLGAYLTVKEESY
jgi:hypothetical protein